MIQKCHIKTSTLGYSEPFASVGLLLLLLAASITAVRHQIGCCGHTVLTTWTKVMKHDTCCPVSSSMHYHTDHTPNEDCHSSTKEVIQSRWAVWSTKEHLLSIKASVIIYFAPDVTSLFVNKTFICLVEWLPVIVSVSVQQGWWHQWWCGRSWSQLYSSSSGPLGFFCPFVVDAAAVGSVCDCLFVYVLCVRMCMGGCVCVLLQEISVHLCMSVHRDAGEVVPDDLINCEWKEERGCGSLVNLIE